MESGRALVFDVQRFSLHDGPGIRTTVFFKGCNLRCLWCQNPESLKAGAEISFSPEACVGCGDCVEACGRGAIAMDRPKRVDPARCAACGSCALSCPSRALRLLGKEYGPEELAELALRDKGYYIESGGGVTISGGEPSLQSLFLSEFLPILKKEGIHVCLETNGAFPFSQMENILPLIDLVYFDLKLMSSDRHRESTGAANDRILENFASLSRNGMRVQPRMPLIPGVNDDAENIAATANFIGSNGHTSIHCLPYHGLGAGKLRKMIDPPRAAEYGEATREDIERVKRSFNEEGIDAVIYGQ
jgi:pyruvate formate lyase activating enzyme